MYIAARGPSRRGEGKDMAQRDVEGQVALRLLDELVIRLERRKILPSHDIENIVAELSAQADRMEPSEQKDVIRTAKRRALGWLDRKSVVSGKSVSGRVELGGRRLIKKKNHNIIS